VVPQIAPYLTSVAVGIGAIRLRTELLPRVDSASASSGEEHHRWWRTKRCGTRIEALLTGLAERLVEQPRKGFRCFGALASGLIMLEKSRLGGSRSVGPPAMDEETDQDESEQEELVK
jgi:hypothetical protein